jgi:PAS domain S-box-containing protein
MEQPNGVPPDNERFATAWSEAHLRRLWEGSLDGFRVTDEGGIIVRVNPACCRIFGKTREEMEGAVFTCCYREDARAEVMAVHNSCLNGHSVPIRTEWDLPRSDGQRLCLEVSYSAIAAAGGRVVLSILRDVTAQKRSQEELQKNEEKYRGLVETTPDWIWEVDLAGRLTYSNASVQGILGYQPEEVVGHSMAWLLDPADGRGMEERLSGVGAERRGWKNLVLRWRHKDGSWRYLESYASPILDMHGKVAGYRGVDRDITEQRAMLQRFDQAQKLESIGRLAGGIAHDFNNLLTVILGYSNQVLDKLFPSDPLHGPVSAIEKAGRRAADLTRQLLAFSRRQAVQPALLDLNSIIADTERMLRRVIGEDIALSTSLCPDLKLVVADPGQIAQVLMNLAVNARDAMPKGGEILIATSHVEISDTSAQGSAGLWPGSWVLLTFSDTGIGMDEYVQSRLFEPFFTTKQPEKGTGLGLSTVYGIVKQAGGHIWVYSELMKGSTFKIYLPAIQGAAASPAPETAAPDPRGTETVLLVEDQEEVRKFVVQSLEPLGYAVLPASSPADCLKLLEHYDKPIDLVVTDMVMPGMSGSQLVAKIEKLRPEIRRVLYMSGYAEELVLSPDNIKTGVWYLSKPFTRQMLAAKIREAVSSKSKPSVLVVDDEEDVRRFLADVLRDDGYEVSEAANGKLAFEALKQHRVDLMITDLAMPVWEGIETIQQVRQAHPSIKIISISGRFSDEILHATRLLGADTTLAKPISAELLRQTAFELLGE